MIDSRVAIGAIAALLIVWGLIREHRKDMSDIANYKSRPDERNTLEQWRRYWRT